MELNNRIQELTQACGADFFGVADLTSAHEAILAQGGSVIASFPKAIAVGIRLLDTIVDQLPQREHLAVAVSYRHHAYEVINQRLDLLTSELGSLLQRAGFNALPIGASKRVDTKRICAAFSHKLGAHLAGLGWIGKSCLLITPQAGPRVRWATVLTDAPLQVTGEPMDDRCGKCQECVEICPLQAFTGEPFRPEDLREVRYDARKCEQYMDAMKADTGLPVCGLCLYICPHGRRKNLIS